MSFFCLDNMRVSIIELAVKKINFPAKTQTFPKCGLHNSPTALNKDSQRLLYSITGLSTSEYSNLRLGHHS